MKSSSTLVHAHNISCRFDQTNTSLFDNLSITLGAGIQCLVGRNGSGKSQLAAMLAKAIPCSEGVVTHNGQVGYLSQGIELPAQSVAELLGIAKLQSAWQRMQSGECTEQDMDLLDGHWDFEQKTENALSAFGFSLEVLPKCITTFSGGQQTKLRLIQLLLAGCDVFILDEPSNHLDQTSRQQLVHWLKALPSCFVVTHDRQILDVAHEIYELEQGDLRKVRGNWEVFERTKEQQLQTLTHQEHTTSKALSQAKRKQAELQEKQAKQSKQGASNRKNANQSKLILDKAKETSQNSQGTKAKAAQQAMDEQQSQLATVKAQKALVDPLHFHVALPRQKSGVLIQLHHLELPFVQIEKIDLQLQSGQKLAVLGDNGCGKSTLLRVIAGLIKAESGEVGVSGNVRYLDQHFSLLKSEQTALQNFQTLCPGFTETEYRTLLAQVRLRRDKALYPIQHLSGGERLKVALAGLFFGEYSPDVLLLDEPDNHLDLESKQLLAQTLNNYQGCLIVVSHDPTFIADCGISETLHL